MEFKVNINKLGYQTYRATVINTEDREIYYTSDKYSTEKEAQKEVDFWLKWSYGLKEGNADSVYYILAVPQDWVGSKLMDLLPYYGLKVKIGYSKHPDKRVKELQTGTSDQLILHAIEPGDQNLERKRHMEFSDHWSHGEWFICSKALADHMLTVWEKYRVLPPEHQQHILTLMNRIKLFRSLNRFWPGGPDLVNPPLDLPWKGKVFLDLTRF